MTMSFCIQIGDSKPNLEQITSIILSTFSEINAIYNHWNPQSEIAKLNALPAYTKTQVSPDLAHFLRKMALLVQLTEGRFDPTIAPVKNALLQNCLQAIPYDAVGWKNVHLEEDFFWKEHDATALDLSGVAKGYAVDLILEHLQEAGYRNLYVEWGGEIRTAGSHPDQRPWKIAIRGGDILNMQDGAIATSGSYFQQWVLEDSSYTHIIDPRTKKPLVNAPITSASVLCQTCFEADVFATALMLFPSVEEAYAWAETQHLTVWLY